MWEKFCSKIAKVLFFYFLNGAYRLWAKIAQNLQFFLSTQGWSQGEAEKWAERCLTSSYTNIRLKLLVAL